MSVRRPPPVRRSRGDDASGALVGAPASPAMVQFSVVEIREFERVVGDNPSCSSGMWVRRGVEDGAEGVVNCQEMKCLPRFGLPSVIVDTILDF